MNFTGVVSVGCHVGFFKMCRRIDLSLFLGDRGVGNCAVLDKLERASHYFTESCYKRSLKKS